MKSLTNYIFEKLVINKNYNNIYNYYPNDKDELMQAIQEHYDKGIYDLNDIDVSKITDFSSIFDKDKNTGNENFDVSKWNVSNGKNFTHMFYECSEFNCDLSEWDVSNGECFSYMFFKCNIFNRNLSEWDVSNGKDFSRMFQYCYQFNSNLRKWDVSNGKDFSYMFFACYRFNSNISNWKISENANTFKMFSS